MYPALVRKYFMFFVLMGLLLLLPLYSFSQLNQYRREIEKTKKEIEKLEKEKEEISSKKNSSFNNINIVSRKISLNNRLINKMVKEIRQQEKAITQKQNEINLYNRKLEILKSDYGKTLRHSQLFNNKSSIVASLVSSDNVNQAFRRSRYIKEYNEARKEMYTNIKDLTQKLEKNIEKLNEIRDYKEKILLDIQLTKSRNVKEKSTLSRYIANLKMKEKQSTEKIKKKIKEKEQLEKIIAQELKKIAEQNKKRNSSQISLDSELTKKFLAQKGNLKIPLESGVIISTFGKHRHPVHKNVFTNNNGVDILTPSGSSVKSIFDGTVTTILTLSGTNKTIIVRHGEYLTVYSNITTSFINKGETVRQGQNIGKIENGQKKVSLHLEIWNKQKPQNPEHWIKMN